jgi:hypothetical protein
MPLSGVRCVEYLLQHLIPDGKAKVSVLIHKSGDLPKCQYDPPSVERPSTDQTIFDEKIVYQAWLQKAARLFLLQKSLEYWKRYRLTSPEAEDDRGEREQ